jgi:hypothetical protein
VIRQEGIFTQEIISSGGMRNLGNKFMSYYTVLHWMMRYMVLDKVPCGIMTVTVAKLQWRSYSQFLK